MKKILFILFLLFSLWGNSQNLKELKSICEKENTARSWNELAQYYIKTDSDIELIKQTANKAYGRALEENNDEETGVALMLLAEYDDSGQWNTYINKYSEALTFLDKTDNSRLQIEALNNMGYAYNVTGQYDKAIEQYKEAEKRFSGLETPEKFAAVYINMGFSFLYKGQTDSTLYYITQAQEAAIIAQDTVVLIACNDQLGIIYKRQGNYTSAIHYYDENLRLYESTKNDKAIYATLMNIAIVYNEWMIPDKALYFARESVKYAYKYPNEKHGLGRTLAGLGSILCNNHSFTAALDTLILAVPLLEESKYESYSNYINLSNAYFHLNQIDSADICMQKAEDILLENINFPAYRFYGGKGSQLAKRGHYDEAIPLLEKYAEEVRNTQKKYIFGEYDIYNLLATSLENGVKDYKKALLYKNMAYDYRDSLYKDQQSRIVNDLFVKYQTAEKDLQISQLNRKQQEMHYNRMFMIGIFVIVAILLLLAWLYNRFLIIKRDKEAVELKSRIEEKENDYQKLLSNIDLRQMKHYLTGLEAERERLAKELHDHISNNIFVLDMELKANKQIPENIHSRIEELYTQVRSISHDLMPPAFQYATLYQALESYLDVLNEQSDIAFELIIQGQEVEIPEKIAFEIYRIIQETTSNIIKHSQAQTAQITLQAGKEHVKLKIEDNGKGFDMQKKNQGIGLRIIIDRCKSIHGSLDVKSDTGQGCKIEIKIPLNQQDSDV